MVDHILKTTVYTGGEFSRFKQKSITIKDTEIPLMVSKAIYI